MYRLGTSLLVAAMLAMCLSCALPATAQNVVALNSVAVSGKQRMLGQRVLKAYAQLSLNVAPEKAKTILAASLDELKSSNGTLRAMAREPHVASALQAQTIFIDKLAAVTATPPNASSLQQAAQISEDLLVNAEAVTQGFIKSGAEAPAAMVNLAARQRMLSQRAAGAYFVYQAGGRTSPDLKARALKAASDFKTAINAFDDARGEFPQIADRIETARIQMVFFDNALSNIDSPSKEQFTTIAGTSERILGEMDSMTSEMVKLVAARNAAPPIAAAKKK
ncbi:MAG TPA: hypothetical protein VLI46_02025 [Ramlibacter sp.]|nr:hypothetical protein [Ramlibacter sp.]